MHSPFDPESRGTAALASNQAMGLLGDMRGFTRRTTRRRTRPRTSQEDTAATSIFNDLPGIRVTCLPTYDGGRQNAYLALCYEHLAERGLIVFPHADFTFRWLRRHRRDLTFLHFGQGALARRCDLLVAHHRAVADEVARQLSGALREALAEAAASLPWQLNVRRVAAAAAGRALPNWEEIAEQLAVYLLESVGSHERLDELAMRTWPLLDTRSPVRPLFPLLAAEPALLDARPEPEAAAPLVRASRHPSTASE